MPTNVDLPTIVETIQQFNLQPKKSLGQNFLTDLNITSKIAKCAGNLKDYTIIEVGSGPGALTRSLLSEGANNLYCIEKDDRSIKVLQYLKDHFPNSITIINQDALNIDWTTICQTPYKIIANLPYNISTVLLIDWLECNSYIPQMTLMFQKEVAERLVAKPGNKIYGRLSILTQYCYDVRLEFTLPPHVFFPAPKVYSSVVNFYSKSKEFDDVLWSKLKIITRHAFAQRRKTIKNQLKNVIPNIDDWLEQLKIKPQARAEELSLSTYCQMASLLPESTHA